MGKVGCGSGSLGEILLLPVMGMIGLVTGRDPVLVGMVSLTLGGRVETLEGILAVWPWSAGAALADFMPKWVLEARAANIIKIPHG